MRKERHYMKAIKIQDLNWCFKCFILIFLFSCNNEKQIQNGDIHSFSTLLTRINNNSALLTIKSRFSNNDLIELEIVGEGEGLSVIPVEIFKFYNLNKLSLINVGLDSLRDLSNLKNVNYLDLSFNNLKGGVDVESLPPNIHELSLSFNKIDSLYNCKGKKKFRVFIAGNKINDTSKCFSSAVQNVENKAENKKGDAGR
jgi:Leucine-rich repeat (LRR) protein